RVLLLPALLAAAPGRPLDSPPGLGQQVVLVVLHGLVDRQVQGVALGAERDGRLVGRGGWFVANDLRRPRPGQLGLAALLAEVRLPEAVEERLREPLEEGLGSVGGRVEDRLADRG